MGRTNHLATASSLSNSPRGPSMDYDENADMKQVERETDILKTLAKRGYRAIKELERVLFFTDLEDRQEAAKKGLNAVHDLQRLLFASEYDSDEEEDKAITNNSNNEPLPSVSEPASSSALVATTVKITAMLEFLKTQFQSALKAGKTAGHAAWNEIEVTRKETERRLFLTDLDEQALRASGASADVRDEIELVVKEVEDTLTKYASSEHRQRIWKQMALSTQQARDDMELVYKECERTLLFTDLNRPALLTRSRTNDDVINHFIKSQKVFQEMKERGQISR